MLKKRGGGGGTDSQRGTGKRQGHLPSMQSWVPESRPGPLPLTPPLPWPPAVSALPWLSVVHVQTARTSTGPAPPLRRHGWRRALMREGVCE